MSETITARFDVTGFEPSSIPGIADGAPGDWVGALIMRKTFTEGFDGSSVLHFVSSGEEPNRAYLAAERMTGALPDGRSGAITIHHWGTQFGDDFTTDGILIPGSGTGDFAHWRGLAQIRHDERGPYFFFTLV